MKINEKNLAAFATSATPVDREGWLVKRGEVNKGYQRRWFVLKGNLLFYYEKRGDREPVGVIILEGCTIELAEDEEQFGFKVVFHGTGNRSYVLGAESQESMEQWMKTLACASYDYMKLMVAELQRQLDEMDECETVNANNQAAALRCADDVRTEAPGGRSCESPRPPPRQRHNPFNRTDSGAHHHQPYRSHSVRSAPGRADSGAAENVPRTKVTFRELHTAYGRRVLSDFNTWKYMKRAEQEKKMDSATQGLLITLVAQAVLVDLALIWLFNNK